MGNTAAFELDSLQTVLTTPEMRADPYPFYRQLREQQPRCHAKQFDAWVFTRHADCAAVLRDSRFSSSSQHQENYEQFTGMVRELGFGAIVDMMANTLLMIDPPDHTRLRRLASKAFTPKAVEAMRPHIAEIVDSLLDLVEDGEGMDLVADLALPLPVTVICEMLGVPAADQAQLREWTDAAVKLLDPGDDFSVFIPANEAVQGFTAYFSELLNERRKNPGDDLLSGLAAVEEEGDQLSEPELLALVILLFGAGHETTVNLLGNGVLALLRNRDQYERLVADRSLVPSAVEEMLRYDSPVQLTGRNVPADFDFDGLQLRKGQQVVTLLGAANRDPEAFDEPERFDVGRNDNRHLAFSAGIHHCLGAPLARVEARVALVALAERFPDLQLADPDPPRKETVNLRGLASLPVRF